MVQTVAKKIRTIRYHMDNLVRGMENRERFSFKKCNPGNALEKHLM
jgi:hypothetical protein